MASGSLSQVALTISTGGLVFMKDRGGSGNDGARDKCLIVTSRNKHLNNQGGDTIGRKM